MENVIKTVNQNIFTDEQIPSEILGLKLDPEQKEQLRHGQWSGVLENLRLEDGVIRDGKVKLSKTKTGETAIEFNFKNEQLVIPKKIGSHQLTKAQIEDLLNNKTVGPIKYQDNEIYLKVDKDLNKVTVQSPKEIGIPKEIGGYRLREEDKTLLSNGQTLPSKVFKGEHGYFIATVKITADKRGLEFSNIKSINQNQAEELMKKQNFTQIKDTTVENVISAIPTQQKSPEADKKDIIKESKSIVENVVSATNQPQIKYDEVAKRLEEAIFKKDLKEVHAIISSGYSPAKELMNKVALSPFLEKEEKIAILTTMKLDPEKILTEPKQKDLIEKKPVTAQNKEEQSKLGIEKTEPGKLQKSKDNTKTVKTGQDLLSQGFSNM